MRVLLDATSVLDMTSTKSKYIDNRNHYLRVRADNECFVTPVTVSETWSYVRDEGVGSKRQAEIAEIFRDCQFVPLSVEIALHLVEMASRVKDLPHKNHQNDYWQMACADFFNMAIATRDKGIIKQDFITTL